MKWKMTTLRFSKEQYEKIKAKAEREHKSIASVIRGIAEQVIKNE